MPTRLSNSLLLATLTSLSLAGNSASPALADAAPPLTPPASSIGPSSSTQVQMWSEVVLLDARGLASVDGVVSVTARFRMRNVGLMPEQLRVRFPLEHPEGQGDGYGDFPIVENVVVHIDSQLAQTAEVFEATYWPELDRRIRWATFDVLFPVDRDVIITVEYTVHAGYDESGLRLDYVMETGGGWARSIERAEIIVRLPYPATPTVFLGTYLWSPWNNYVLSGDTIRWIRWNFEPAQHDNFKVWLLPPHLWSQILALQRPIANGTACEADYVALAEAYWQATTWIADGWSSHRRLLEAAEALATRGLRQFPESEDLIVERAFFLLETLLGGEGIAARTLSQSEQAAVDSARCAIAHSWREVGRPSSDILLIAATLYGIQRPIIECAVAHQSR